VRARTAPRFALAAVTVMAMSMPFAVAASPRYDITTLAGKVAALYGTAGLQVRFLGAD
jgi:hypothetical protein